MNRWMFFFKCALFVLVSIKAIAQVNDPVPPSPNAAALGRYGQVPVGLFTGTAQVSIPLCDVKDGYLASPVLLNYSSNGVRVDEMASYTGLGWVLKAGGVVTRTMRDDPDTEAPRLLPYDNNGNIYPSQSAEMLSYMQAVARPYDGDAEPDIFSFHFGEYSGKFVINLSGSPLQGTAVLLEPSPLKIELLSNFYNEAGDVDPSPKIKIIDPQGIVYLFGGLNATELSIYRTAYNEGPNPPSFAINAWYLSTIEHLNGDRITFNYSKKSIQYNASLSQSLRKVVNSEILMASNPSEACDQFTDYVLPKVQLVTTVMCQLQSITTSNEGSVEFSYSPYLEHERFELLDTVAVFNKDHDLLKSFALDYDVLRSTAFKNSQIVLNSEDLVRVFLRSVLETGSDGSASRPYQLEYYNANELPARLSYAQDYWGYFNGYSNKYLFTDDVNAGYIRGVDAAKINYVFKDAGGNKNARFEYAVKGMLKKIIYPTGGYSEFSYESHSYYGLKTFYPPAEYVSLNVLTESADIADTDIRSIPYVPFDQTIRFNVSNVTQNRSTPDCDYDGYPTHKLKGVFTVNNLTTGEKATLYMDSPYTTAPIELGETLILAQNNPTDEFFFHVTTNNAYEVKLSANFECITVGASFSYYDEPYTIQNVNNPVGGVRIKTITSDDGMNKKEVKTYQYGTAQCPDCSSGIASAIEPGIVVSVNEIDIERLVIDNENYGPLNKICTFVTLQSNSYYPLYSSQGYHIMYPSVIEIDGTDSQNGRIRHEFEVKEDLLPDQRLGVIIPLTPFSNSFGSGREIYTYYEKKIGTNAFEVVKVIENHYAHDPRKDLTLWGWRANKFKTKTEDMWVATEYGSELIQYSNDMNDMWDLNRYYTKSEWHYLTSTKVSERDESGNVLVSEIEYTYGNEKHMQATNVRRTNSDGKTVDETSRYPLDYNTQDWIATLIGKNIVVPIKSETLIDGKLISGSVIKYNNYGLPTFIHKYESATLSNPPPHDPNPLNYVPANFYLHTSVTYNSKGRIAGIAVRGKPAMAYSWGYNSTSVVASAANATPDRIYFNGFEDTGSVANAKTGKRSFFGNTFTIPAADFTPSTTSGLKVSFWYLDGAEWKFREQTYTSNVITTIGSMIDDLRIYPADAQMTTYTYLPGVGMSSSTDMNGIITRYDFDKLGRLQQIKDSDGNILKRYGYHLKWQ